MTTLTTCSGSWLLGWLLAVLSGTLFTANNFLVKYFTIQAVEMLMVRSCLQTVLMALVIILTDRSFPATKNVEKVLVGLQGLCVGLRILFTFASVQYLPLGDSLTIIFTEPLWTLLLSRIILKVRISTWKMMFGCQLLVGMVLCIQPPFLFLSNTHPLPQQSPVTHLEPVHNVGDVFLRRKRSITEDVEVSADETGYYIGVVLALSTAVMGAMANVCIATCEKVSSKVMVFYSGLGGVLISFICSAFDEEKNIVFNIFTVPTNTWLLLGLVGLLGVIGHFSLTRSLRLIPPTTVAVLRSLEIVLAYIVQALVMREIPNGLSVTGSGLVLVSVLAFALEQMPGGHSKAEG